MTEDGTSQVVSVTINGTSDTPIAADDQLESGTEDTVLTVTPTTSDVDSDSLTITVDSVTEAGGVVTGVTTVDGNGDIVYTPTANFYGETIISYTVSDGSLSDTGLITVSVTSVDDTAIITGMTQGGVVEDATIIAVRVLADGTMTSSTNSNDIHTVGTGGLSDELITVENYLTVQATSDSTESWLTHFYTNGYFPGGPDPVLTINFGSTQILNTILLWGYDFKSAGFVSTNTAKVFDLEIFDSVTNSFVLVESDLDLENFNAATAFAAGTAVKVSLAQSYATNRVRLRFTDNYYGFDSLPYINGTGGRVGLGELAFVNINSSILTGDLDHTDADPSQNDDVWQAVSTATAGTNAYGTYMIDEAGVWTYTVDDNNETVHDLHNGDILTDSFYGLN